MFLVFLIEDLVDLSDEKTGKRTTYLYNTISMIFDSIKLAYNSVISEEIDSGEQQHPIACPNIVCRCPMTAACQRVDERKTPHDQDFLYPSLLNVTLHQFSISRSTRMVDLLIVVEKPVARNGRTTAFIPGIQLHGISDRFRRNDMVLLKSPGYKFVLLFQS